jgi:hypothetical protein
MTDYKKLGMKHAEAIMFEDGFATDAAVSVLKSLKVVAPDGPVLKFAREEAYKYASLGSGGSMTPGLKNAFDNKVHDGIETGTYTGGLKGESGPNILRIYLGLDRNTLKESADKPSSWTKPDPAGGWRSGRDYTTVEVDRYSLLHSEDQAENNDFSARFKVLVDAVNNGTYNPTEHAIKSDPGDEKNPTRIPIDVYSKIDMANFTESIGYDPEMKRYYFSVTDVWDFEDAEAYADKYAPTHTHTHLGGKPLSKEDVEHFDKRNKSAKAQAKLMDAVGIPIGLYDRYYLSDNLVDAMLGKNVREYSLSAEDKIINSMK